MIQELLAGLIRLSEQVVVPDWGALIALIPVGLAGIVFLYLTWTGYRFATAGPVRRGVRRLPPVAPPGVHMPGPSFAPFLAAVGAFMLLFGMFAGGPWLPVGIATLVITLLYWGREALTDYDRAVRGHGVAAPVATGALTVPADRTPPPGVHIPPPSFRPLLVSIAFTLLVGGMVIGGLALVLGVLAMVVALLGWLKDARSEYAAVEDADRTGRLDLGGKPAWPVATFAVLAVITVGALLVTSGFPGTSGGAGASGAPASSGGTANGGIGGSAAPATPAPDADALLVASNLKFDSATLEVPAGVAFKLALDNKDQVPHNVEIKDAGGTSLFQGEVFSGPALKVYDVRALAAGQYTFACTVHPSMTGTITAR